MTHNNYSQRVTAPTAFVTSGRQRVKQYSGQGNGSVYLRNGEEFEIELFNPTSNKVLAKIKLNGNYISSSGIVLRPGERVFLERYLDEARKFAFETYEVDANDPNVKEAIRNNGDLEVEFYDQSQPNSWNISCNPYWEYHPNYPAYYYINGGSTAGNSITYGSSSSGCKGTSGPAESSRTLTATAFSYSVQNDANQMKDFSRDFAPQETGRVEKGDFSNQSFIADSTFFNSYYSWRTFWKILPKSKRPYVKEDLAVYCTNCGAKRRKASHHFCSNCGQRF
jgi:hypothetical protein